MGKGIAIVFYLVMLPATGVLLLAGIATYIGWKKRTAFFVLLAIWGLFISSIGLFYLAEPYFKPMILTQKDIIGTYVIDKNKFPGKQADWQYENFRFTITENEELIFKTRIKDKVWKSDTVKISYSTGYYDSDKKEYCNKRIRIHSDSTSHHIIKDNPTLYRQRFGRFYYVFKSEKFGNVFFKRGEWTDK